MSHNDMPVNDLQTQHPSLGVCERCGVDIPSGNVLIRYRSANGWPKLFAECPECEDVVHPA